MVLCVRISLLRPVNVEGRGGGIFVTALNLSFGSPQARSDRLPADPQKTRNGIRTDTPFQNRPPRHQRSAPNGDRMA
jgi:hypothetical protein